MTIGGAIAELQNLLDADDVPFYYKGGIEKIIETIQMEMTVRKDEPQPNATQRTQHVESVEPIRLDDDGTLWVTVDDCDKVGRVIVDEHKSKWCRTFYEEEPPKGGAE